MTDKETVQITDLRLNLVRTVVFIGICSACIMLLSCRGESGRQVKYEVDSECVYVCSGPTSKRYHSVDDCQGLSNCSGEILEMTQEEAEDIGKTPCRMCVKQ